MKLCCVLPFTCAVLFAAPLLAQEPLPASTEALRATWLQLRVLTQNDLAEISSKAQSGDRKAQYWLALVYQEGHITPRDLAAAHKWMLKSAEQGYAPAQTGMGQTYLPEAHASTVGEYGEADRWLRLAALQGNAEAQFWLGTGYEQGWFGGRDYSEALRWLRKAAQQGLPNAQFCLGQMYEDGEGVPQSDLVAASWYRKAADHSPAYLMGIWEAVVQLAYMYRNDRLPKDDIQAYMWFAILGSSSNPLTDADDLKKISRRMTKPQIVKAQRRTQYWIKRHPFETQTLAQAEK